MHHKTYEPAPAQVTAQASHIRTALGAHAYRAYSYTTTSGPLAGQTFYVVEVQFADKSVTAFTSGVGFDDAIKCGWEHAAEMNEVF